MELEAIRPIHLILLLEQAERDILVKFCEASARAGAYSS